MIRKIIYTFILVYSLWTVILMIMPVQGLSQSQGQDNLMKAQRVIYDDYNAKNVIVGSSLASRIITDSLDHFYNLSFGGLSLYDGLYILQNRKDSFPQTVFIEINLALKEKNETFLNGLYDSPFYYFRKYIIAMREYNQPATFLVKGMTNTANQVRKNKGLVLSADNIDSGIFEKLLNNQKKEYIQTPDEKLISTRFEELKKQIDHLQSKGVNIVFFEIPVNKELMHLPWAETIRNAFRKNFPESKYNYVHLPDNYNDYVSSDGIHLGKREALKYTIYFRDKTSQFTKRY